MLKLFQSPFLVTAPKNFNYFLQALNERHLVPLTFTDRNSRSPSTQWKVENNRPYLAWRKARLSLYRIERFYLGLQIPVSNWNWIFGSHVIFGLELAWLREQLANSIFIYYSIFALGDSHCISPHSHPVHFTFTMTLWARLGWMSVRLNRDSDREDMERGGSNWTLVQAGTLKISTGPSH